MTKGQPAGKAPHPPIVSQDQWLDARKKLLTHEKEQTKHYDRVNAERRRLPMVKVEKGYTFDGPGGKRDFKALFDGRQQLIIYHFMFDPAWQKGCPSCTWYVDSLGDLSLLNERDTTFALVSRAPLAKIEAYRASAVGISRGIRRLAPTSTMISTRPMTPRSGRSNTTTAARPRTRHARAQTTWKAKSTHSASSSRSTRMSSTPIRPTRAVPKRSATPVLCSTPRPMAASRSSRTRPRAGRRSRHMGEDCEAQRL